jgi:hypothetical protein
MELEIGLALLLLIVLSLLATVDMAFAQLSDVGLRRLIGENGDKPEPRSRLFLKQALENRPRFSFALSATIQILLVVVAVLITSISLNLFPIRDSCLSACRWFDPRRNLSSTDPAVHLDAQSGRHAAFSAADHSTVLPIMAFIADPFQRLFDRSRRKDQVLKTARKRKKTTTAAICRR